MLRPRDRRGQFADHGLPPQGGRVQPAGAVPGSAGLLRAGLEDRTKNAGLMMGSATVPVALFGVSPNSGWGRFHSSIGAPGRVLPARRRDADESGRDDRAPQPNGGSPSRPTAQMR